ncbi:MAG: hypothetical protein H6Q43_3485 [Deltaproteobacteria bacterium]|jgi:hypothetical protein|nr:hypothetical protein [Deltaproteobacteria bacterium]
MLLYKFIDAFDSFIKTVTGETRRRNPLITESLNFEFYEIIRTLV